MNLKSFSACLTKSFLILSIVFCICLISSPVDAQTPQPRPPISADTLRVPVGKSIVLQYHEKIQTVSLANESIADIVSATPTDLVIIGNEVGITSLIVWGDSDRHTYYDIKVERAVANQRVVLEVQVAEVNRTALKEYGVDLLYVDEPGGDIRGTQTIGTYAGEVTVPDALTSDIFAQQGMTGIFRWVSSEQRAVAAIKALHENGQIKLLANPRLISLSGEEASFLVGGEIPIPVAQTATGGSVNVTVEWKEYGIKLNFLPTIIDTNLIGLKIMPEVSSLDWTNSVTFGGIEIPALRTRKASSMVEMNSGQSIVLGGLLTTETFESVSKVPILGDIPLIKFFFKHKQFTSSETELLIVISPRIVNNLADEEIPPLPGQEPEVENPGVSE
jgi:pilus assembly protein CpaC